MSVKVRMAVVETHALREEDLIDDADLDSLIREAIAQVDQFFLTLKHLFVIQALTGQCASSFAGNWSDLWETCSGHRRECLRAQ